MLRLPSHRLETIIKSKKNRRGDETPLVKLSKSLSYVLRHHAKDEGLVIREDGYVKLDDLLKLPRFKRTTFEDIKFVVDNNDKKRFTLTQEVSDDDASSWWIRANQGHSIEVKNLELEEITDPLQFPEVIHGTYLRNWKNIESEGLSKMARNHIHLATGLFGTESVISGMRKNCDLFIYINLSKAMEDGIRFFRSANEVILTEGVNGLLNPKYFLKVVDKYGKVIEQANS
ncbi:putative tRNA 2-phosphotransferase [Gigaspora margarita]|uniref:2'-phosphotransferase n=1 Tax=Gigaspora margarita TaxID=4874 RepID=A0A8H4B2J4_GIGMA|nr:putative tRNA 2-phosphotransferase [Gigaspora margarita]